MANAFYNRGASFNPDELADGDAIEAEFDAIGRGFDTIEDLVNANKAGYPTQTFHVAPAELDTHAVPKAQMDAALSFKLDTVNYNASDILTKLKTVDGASSGLDADYLDGQHGSYYRNASNINAGTLAKERLPGTIDSATTGNAATATKVSGGAPVNGDADLVTGTMGSNDFFRIRVGGTDNAGWVELATTDDGNEPIYVRQYGASVRTATLLDTDGNTRIPGKLVSYGMGFSFSDDERHGLFWGGQDGAASTAANIKISSWYGIGFSPSITGQPVPYGEYSHWFNTRNGDMGVRGTITAPRFAGNADTASNATNHINTNGSVHGATPNNSPGNLMMRNSNGDVAARVFVGALAGNADTANLAGSALNNSFFTATNGGEGQIGATCAGYQPAYLFNNSAQWGVFSADGGAAFTYTRGAGFNFNGHANSAAQATAVASGYWDGVDLAYARMAGDDYFRLRAYGSGYDQGAVEIATADNGTEPIYVRQYSGLFASVVRTAALLDGNGNTVFPGYVYAANGVLRETAVLTGEIGHGGTLPIPSGFSEGQCAFFVSPRDTNSSGYNWDLREGISAQHYRIICYPAGRVAQGYTRIYNDVNDSYEDRGFNMSYLVIGVK